jgi:hypothetical protein
LQGSLESKGPAAGAIVGHHTLHLDAEACVIGDGRPQESDGAAPFLVGHC